MKRIFKITNVPSFLLLWVTIVMGNSSSDYFHSGANYYINGKLLEALYEVQTGLEQNPSDPKLNALLQKIQEALQNQQPQQQDQQEQSEEEQQQDQQKDEEQQNQAGDENQQQQEQQKQAEKQEEISKEDAERILKALENQEKEQLQNLKKKGSGRRRSKKDW